MFRGQRRKRKVVFGLFDALLTALAFEAAYLIRQQLPLSLQFYLTAEVRMPLLAACAMTWSAIGYLLDIHGSLESGRFADILRNSIRQVAYGGLALLVFVYGAKLDISRMFLALFVFTTWAFLLAFRLFTGNLAGFISQKFGVERHIMIVGLSPQAVDLGRNIEAQHGQGLRILGFLADDEDSALATIRIGHTYPVYPLADLKTGLARRLVIDEIYFAVESQRLPELKETFEWCQEEGVCSRIMVDFLPAASGHIGMDQLGDSQLLTFAGAPGDELLLLAKRSIDVFVSALLIVLLSPLFLLAAILIKTTSRGPVVFRQVRCGLNGRTFTCYKFRSMVQDAEQRLHEVAHLNKKVIVTKIPNDPRLTGIGRWLRKFSVDELPQLFNVLKGDMSLVGPRPAIPSEVAQYQTWHRRRLRMRPGLTCLWALQGRDTIDFESWMRLDLRYIDSWSLGLDVRIILLTIPRVLSGRGAS